MGDADITFRLYKKFIKNLKLEKLINIYEIFEKPLIKILAFMEMEGVEVDNKFLKSLSSKFEKKIKNLEKEVFKISKKEFNIASPKQLGEIIYNDLKIAGLKKTKKGSFATSASVLEDLAFKGHEFPKLILDWRQVSKLKNTYSDTLPEHINPNTKKGHILISADYNQIEMRILADIADVKELKKAFKNNQDIHALTASQVFDVPISEVTDDFRRKAKAINFGIIYGITQYGLAKQISVSNEEALSFINSYFKKFPEIKDYMNATVKICRKQGYVTNIFGRRINLRGINDKNFSVRSFQERAAINAPIQGSAADIIRLAMIKIDKILEENNKAKMLLQIHDELIFECLAKDENQIKKIIKEAMMSVSSSDYHMFSIPLEVSINSGFNWGEAH